jgi:uncharacterized membrane protein YccC
MSPRGEQAARLWPKVSRKVSRKVWPWLSGASPEFRQAARMLVSVSLSDIVSRLAHLGEPAWALITAVIVTQSKIGATLEAGRDQIVGTLVGAVFGAAAIALSLAGLPKMPVFACLLVPLAIMAAFRPNLRLAGVTLVVVFLFPASGADPFARPIDRTLAILVGAAVSLLVSYVVFRAKARAQAFEAASAMLLTLDATQAAVLAHRLAMPDVERLNDASSEALKTLVAAVAEAKRERLGALDQSEPVLVRLQSDVLFVARALDETLEQEGPQAEPIAALLDVSASVSAAFAAIRAALDQEADQRAHAPEIGTTEAARLSASLQALGDHAGPLPRFTLEMLDRDIHDIVLALKPERQADEKAAA